MKQCICLSKGRYDETFAGEDVFLSETATTGTTAALSTNKLAMVIMKKKKRKERNE